MKAITATLAGEFTAALHYGPGPHPDGSPQSVHAGGARRAADNRPFDERPVDWRAYAAGPDAKLPKSYQKGATDGGPGPALQWHGQRKDQPANFAGRNVAFLTDDPEEANGYARGAHRMANEAGALLLVRRKPGRALNITPLIDQVLMAEGDPDAFIAKHAPALRKRGVSYVFFTHPSWVDGDREQNVLVSLNPERDLSVRARQPVKPK